MNVKELLTVLPTDGKIRIQLTLTGKANITVADIQLFEGSVWEALTSQRDFLEGDVLRIDSGETTLVRCL